MKAPVLVFPQTKVPSTARRYIDPGAAASAEAFGLGVAKGAGSLGSGLVDLAATIQQRNDQVDRFKFLTDFTDFETQAVVQQGELKRKSDSHVTDFPQTSSAVFDSLAETFLKAHNLTDPRLVGEFEAKKTELKQRLFVDAFDFQYKQQDTMFLAGLDSSFQTWRNRVYTDPNLLDQARVDMIEKINATDLPPDVKLKQTQIIRDGLLAASYGANMNRIQREATRTGPPPNYSEGAQSVTAGLTARGLPAMQAAVAAGNIQIESGFRTWAKNAEEGAHGFIQWRLDRWDKMQEAAQTSGKDWRDPQFQMDFFLSEFKHDYPRAWEKFIGATTPEAAQAAIKEYIGYKDEHGRSSATRLEAANAIMNGANPQADVTKRDDTTVEDMRTLNDDPLYNTVSIEDRAAMTASAASRAADEAKDIAKASLEAVNAKKNDLYVGLHDGTYNAQDILRSRKEGWLSDIDDINKAESILTERNKTIKAATDFQSILDAGGTGYNRVTMNGDGSIYNKWVGEEGLKRISAMDDDYMNKMILPAVGKVGDIPTDVVGQLQSMSVNQDPRQMLWAYRQLAQMSDISRSALRERTTEDLQLKIDNYRDLVGSANEKEMVDFLRGGTTREQVLASEQKDAQANLLLNNSSSKVYKNIRHLTDDSGSWFGLFGDAGIPQNMTEVSSKLERYARERFKLNFRASGDEAKAVDAMNAQVYDRWGVSGFGGSGNMLMEHPIDKPGVYPPINGSWDAYETQIRSDKNLGIASADTFRLISDNQTDQEFDAYKLGRRKELPTYQVLVIHEDGTQTPPEKRWRWGGDPNVAPVEEE